MGLNSINGIKKKLKRLKQILKNLKQNRVYKITLFFFIFKYMKITVFNTDEYKGYRFLVRLLNSIVFCGLALPIFLYCTDAIIFNSFDEFLLVSILSIMLLAVPCVGITVAINEECKGYYMTRFIGSVICAPTLIIVEPIMKIMYYIVRHKSYKHRVLYKLINSLPEY